MIWCPGFCWLSTGLGADHAIPSADVESTTRPSPSIGLGRSTAYPRADQARYARPVPSMAIVGKALVRKDVSVVPCSKGLKLATTLGEEKVPPPLTDRTVTIASGSTPSSNCR